MNFLRRLTMGILRGNPKGEPMHYGEVFGTWSFLMAGRKRNDCGLSDTKKSRRGSRLN